MVEETNIIINEKPKLNKPLFISGLPGIGYIGRNAIAYIIDELKAKKFAELTSKHFPPVVLLDHERTGKMHELKNEFYYYKAKNKKQKDMIILIGDAQSIDPIGHYLISDKIAEFAKKMNVSEIITIAGFATGKLEDLDESKVFGAAIKDNIIKKFESLGVTFKETQIGQIIGASGLLIIDAEKQGIDGVCLMGETSGMLLSDPKATESVLKVLSKYLGIAINMDKIIDNVKNTEKIIKKIETLQKKMLSPASGQKADEQLGYIG